MFEGGGYGASRGVSYLAVHPYSLSHVPLPEFRVRTNDDQVLAPLRPVLHTERNGGQDVRHCTREIAVLGRRNEGNCRKDESLESACFDPSNERLVSTRRALLRRYARAWI